MTLSPSTHPLRRLRAARMLTQAQLAHDAHVALRTINNIERGHGCRNETKRRILKALKIDFALHAEVFPERDEVSE